MIEVGQTFAIGRARRFELDPDGHGEARAVIEPVNRTEEYVVMVLGRKPRGQRITSEEVLQALRDIVAREEAIEAQT